MVEACFKLPICDCRFAIESQLQIANCKLQIANPRQLNPLLKPVLKPLAGVASVSVKLITSTAVLR